MYKGPDDGHDGYSFSSDRLETILLVNKSSGPMCCHVIWRRQKVDDFLNYTGTTRITHNFTGTTHKLQEKG